jgi:hypothetical protein
MSRVPLESSRRAVSKSQRPVRSLTGSRKAICCAESGEGDSATLRTVTRPPVGAQPVALAPSLSWCVPGTQWRLALARIQSTRVLPCLLSSIPPDRRPAICLLRPQELHHRRIVQGYSRRRTTPCFEHHPPRARDGARCLTQPLQPISALICPTSTTRLYSLYMRG